MSEFEANLLDRAVSAGGYKSRSEFLRFTIHHVAPGVIENPVVGQQAALAIEVAAAQPKLEEPPNVMEAPPAPVDEFQQPNLLELLGVPLYAPVDPLETPETPRAALLDFDDEGWVG
jgi:hypothetical protein